LFQNKQSALHYSPLLKGMLYNLPQLFLFLMEVNEFPKNKHSFVISKKKIDLKNRENFLRE